MQNQAGYFFPGNISIFPDFWLHSHLNVPLVPFDPFESWYVHLIENGFIDKTCSQSASQRLIVGSFDASCCSGRYFSFGLSVGVTTDYLLGARTCVWLRRLYKTNKCFTQLPHRSPSRRGAGMLMCFLNTSLHPCWWSRTSSISSKLVKNCCVWTVIKG